MRALSFGVNFLIPVLVKIWVQRSKMSSGAPFTKAMCSWSCRHTTVMRLRSELKGNSLIRG